VLLPDYNFFAVPAMVRRAGLRPVFVDVTSPHGEMSLEHAVRAVTPRTRAVLLGHYFGRPNDLPAWHAFAVAHGLTLLEDCAHAFGASIAARSVGRWGAGGAFSLSLTKGLTGVMGGAVVSDDDAMGEWLRDAEHADPLPRREVVRAIASALGGKALFGQASYPAIFRPLQGLAAVHGVDLYERLMAERPLDCDPPAVATPAALPAACAALARTHLPRALTDVARQRQVARRVLTARAWRRFSAPTWEDDRLATGLNLVLRSPERAALRDFLWRQGFDTRADYLTSSTRDPTRFPVSVQLVREGLYLPTRSLRHDDDATRLIHALTAWDDGAA
jgi:dTDP-4-amino-4,6-dideoxygalactose transaminase